MVPEMIEEMIKVTVDMKLEGKSVQSRFRRLHELSTPINSNSIRMSILISQI